MSDRYVELSAYEFTKLKGICDTTYGFTIGDGNHSVWCNSVMSVEVLGPDRDLLKLAAELAVYDPRVKELIDQGATEGMIINDTFYDEKEIAKMLASTK